LLDMIKFEHTVFALPFALLGALAPARGLPPLEKVGWILAAMVGARSAATERALTGTEPPSRRAAIDRQPLHLHVSGQRSGKAQVKHLARLFVGVQPA